MRFKLKQKNIIKYLVIKKTSLYLHRKIKTPTGRLPGTSYDIQKR